MGKYKIIPSSRTIVQSPISIGHKAEKGVEAIEFDLTAWVETYGSGTLTVIMRRWGDSIPYPIALEIGEDNKATWTLSDIDTAKAGMAYAQLNYIVGDEVVKKSDIYTFRVMDSLTGEGEPPEAYESWLEHLTHLAAEAMAEVLDIEGIVTDKTLTVDGGIADAKAAGDALALKADKSTTYTKTEVDQMIEDVEVETDTTLSVSGAPADAAETGRQIGLLKADLGDFTNAEEITGWKTGYYDLSDGITSVDISSRTSNTGYVSTYAQCDSGDVFYITASGASAARPWAFLDASGNILIRSGSNLSQLTIAKQREVVPDGAKYIVVNSKKNYDYNLIRGEYIQGFISSRMWAGKTIVCFGDSRTWYDGRKYNTDGILPEWAGKVCNGYQSVMRNVLGAIVINAGISGNTSVQICERIKSYNYTGVDAVFIEGGVNDYVNGVNVGNIEPVGSDFDTTTVYGALQSAIEYLINNHPSVKIFMDVPTIAWTIYGIYPYDMALVKADVARLYNIPYKDAYTEMGITKDNRGYYFADNGNNDLYLHLNDYGNEKLGLIISSLFNGSASVPQDRNEKIDLISEKTNNEARVNNGQYIAGDYSVSVSNGLITVNGTSDKRSITYLSNAIRLHPGNYTCAFKPCNDNAYTMRTRLSFHIVTNDKTSLCNMAVTPTTFTVTSETDVYILAYIGTNGTQSEFEDCQYVLILNEGDTLRDYEPPFTAVDMVARQGVMGETHLPGAFFINAEVRPTDNTIIRALGRALTNFLPPIYSMAVVESGYQMRVNQYDKQYNFIGVLGWSAENYTFDFDTYNYRITIRKPDNSRLDNLTEVSEALTLKLDLSKFSLYLDEHIESEIKAQSINANYNVRNRLIMTSNYNLRFANSARPLPLVNVYGNTQNVHPKVLYIPEGFGGHKYWMAYTPYPYSRTNTENPCIAYSDDGISFTNIAANPIDTPATSGESYYNSDTHLVLVDGVLECWYRYVVPDNEYIYRQTSTDGITWENKELLHTSEAHSAVLCPIVIYENSTYKIWVVNNSAKKVDYYESATGTNWSLIRTITAGSFTYNGLTYYPWHGDIIHDGNQYIMVMMCKNTTGNDAWVSVLQTSMDNVIYTEPSVILGAGMWDDVQYRVSITKIDALYRLYYSGIGRGTLNNAVYGIGISESETLDKFIGVNY